MQPLLLLLAAEARKIHQILVPQDLAALHHLDHLAQVAVRLEIKTIAIMLREALALVAHIQTTLVVVDRAG